MGVKVKQRAGKGDGWWIFINHKGQRRNIHVGELKAAQAVAMQVQAELAMGNLNSLNQKKGGKATEKTFGEYAAENPLGKKQTSKDTYADCQKRYILPRFGKRRLSTITRDEIKALLKELTKQGLSLNTIKLVVASLRGVLNLAWEEKLITANPAARLGRYMVSEKATRKAQAMKGEEVELFLKSACDYCGEYYPLLQIAVEAGLREGEILGLRWGDCQFGREETDPRFFFVQQRWYHKNGGSFASPKGGKSRRVDMSLGLRRTLMELRDRRMLEAFQQGKASIVDDLLFPGKRQRKHPARNYFVGRGAGRPISVNMVLGYGFFPALEKAGLRKFAFHDLRHTFGSVLLDELEAPLKYVSEQMGHSSIKVTADTYIHLREGRHVGYVDKLDRFAPDAATSTQPGSGEQLEMSLSDWKQMPNLAHLDLGAKHTVSNGGVDSKQLQQDSYANQRKVMQNTQPRRNPK